MKSWTEKLNAPARAEVSEITPFWRVLDAKTPTTKRPSFGARRSWSSNGLTKGWKTEK